MTLRAFILMPFDSSFQGIYEQMIVPSLERANYTVNRADSVLDQQSVLRDIITGVHTADLIVADLTGRNPNVFYELGVAHGLGIPTVLLTQSIGDVPFDLRTYRVSEYSTRFDLAPKLGEKLEQIGREHSEGKIVFGSPVSDFLPNSQAAAKLMTRETVSASAEADEEKADVQEAADGVAETRGTIDLLADMTKAMEAIGPIGQAIGHETEEITERLDYHTKRFGEVSHLPGSLSISGAQEAASGLARDLDKYASAINKPIDDLEQVTEEFSDTAIVWLSRLGETEDQRDQIEEFRSELADLGQTVDESVTTMGEFGAAMQTIRGVSKDIDKSVDKVMRALDQMIASLDYLRAFVTRGLSVADEKLAQGDAPDDGLSPDETPEGDDGPAGDGVEDPEE